MRSRIQAGLGIRFAAVALVFFTAACDDPNTYVEPPPPKVTVAQPAVQKVTDYLEFTGNTAAAARVEVRARVPGTLLAREFVPGTVVDKGQLLFKVDPQEYQANMQAAEAELARAEARKSQADKTLLRARELSGRGNVSEAKLDEAEADAQAAAAEVLVRRAALRQAEIDLGYTEITAPIRGRVGRSKVDVGNLVGISEATVLTEITANDPMYVYFNLNELDLLRVMKLYRERVKASGHDPKEDATEDVGLVLQLGLADEAGYPHEGVLDFAESGVDSDTGTLQLRGVFSNTEVPPVLVPGLFARVRMPIGERADLPLVSERAIGTGQEGSFVLVVNADNVVETRVVKLGQRIDGMRVIEDGLGAGEWVVVNGLQRARPGREVQADKAPMTSAAAPARRAIAEAKQPRSASARSVSD